MFNNSWHNNSLIPRISDYELDYNYKIDVVKLLEQTTQRTTLQNIEKKIITRTTTITTKGLDFWMIYKHLHRHNSVKNKETNLHRKAEMIYANSTASRENM